MTLLLSTDALVARRIALADDAALGGLALSLQRELHAALDVAVPEGKARLTRTGGRCARCTVLLAFDPREPHRHRCPTCGDVYTDIVHHQWWLMNAHLWTAEQCTRAAALALFRGDDAAAARADAILSTYADRYLTWLNQDNALGPTRPFFSTYLESIWLLHLAVALDLRECAGSTSLGGMVREKLIEPSASLIASFPEGRSNREVWHVAARLAAAQLLDDAPLRDDAAQSLRTLLRTGLHSDGSWYEGENYHLFAHRGLLSAVTLAERAGLEIAPDLLTKFEAGFSAPFRTMLPDGTYPARRDSQYGVSLRQYRTADWLECGLARRDDAPRRAALAMLYDPTAPLGETGRATSTGDAERNQRGVRLTRADTNWRALLLARLELPSLSDATPRTELLEGQGLAVFRRNGGRFWVGLDYGDPGAGHGHPDRLNLVIATDTHRWLDDMGTGSYTSPTLAWYRSTRAHNAPMVSDHDQGAASGQLLAFDEQGAAGWVMATFTDPMSHVRFVRTVVVAEDHVLDELTWSGDGREVFVDLPLQARIREVLSELPWRHLTDQAPSDFVSENSGATIARAAITSMLCSALPSPAVSGALPAQDFQLHCWTETPAFIARATTIGPPAGQPHGMVTLRQFTEGGYDGTPFRPHGRSVRLIAAATTPLTLRVHDAICIVSRPDGSEARHERTDGGWVIEDHRDTEPGRVVSLGGTRATQNAPVSQSAAAATLHERIIGTPSNEPGHVSSSHALGESSYRPTEVAWRDAGRPSAEVSVTMAVPHGDRVTIHADVSLHRAPVFAEPVSENPLDNEHPDTNSDGVQLHWQSAVGGGWNSLLAVPIAGGEVRLSVIAGMADGLSASWLPTAQGYALTFTLPWPGPDVPYTFDLIVNERPAGRERRRGQLVLSGAHGESAYLRGARQEPDRALTILFQHPTS